MTDLLSRPMLRVRPAETTPQRGFVLVCALGATAVALGGLLLCEGVSAAGWFAADSGDFRQAMGVGALGWLVGNGSGLTGGGLSVGAMPLGFLLLAAVALHRLGRWAGATCRIWSLAEVGQAALTIGGAYGAIGTAIAVLTKVEGVHAPPLRAALATCALGLVFGGAGALRGSGRAAMVFLRLPEEARAAVLGGAAGLLALLAISAIAFVASLVLHLATALELAQGLHSGLVGGVILALVSAALVPNAVLCAGSFLAGPGFAVGTGTSVSPSGVHLGLLPDFPVLAALPSSSDARWLPALILLPVVTGGVAGLVAVRRYPVFGIDQAALRGALAGLAGGVGFGLLTFAADGGVGPGRMQHIGPDALATTAVCAVAFLLGGALAGVSSRLLNGVFSGFWRRTGSSLRSLRRRDGAVAVTEPDDDEATQPIATSGVEAP